MFHFHADRCCFHWCVYAKFSTFYQVCFFFAWFRIWMKQNENERTSLIAKYVKYPDWNMPNTVYRIEIGLSLFLSRPLVSVALFSFEFSIKRVNNKTNWTKKCACVCVYMIVGTQSTNAWITIFDPRKEQRTGNTNRLKNWPHTRDTKQQKFTLYIWWRRQTKA